MNQKINYPSSNQIKIKHQYRLISQALDAYLANLPSPKKEWPWDVRLLLRGLHENLFETEASVGRILELYGLKDRRVSARFAHYVGCGPRKYLTHHRIEAAKRLLSNEAFSITQIALAVGYRRSHALTMAFHRVEEMTPSGYRAQHTKRPSANPQS